MKGMKLDKWDKAYDATWALVMMLERLKVGGYLFNPYSGSNAATIVKYIARRIKGA